MMNLLAIDWANVWGWTKGILLAILILLAMVTIHEFGHYVAGKLLGFKITEFSVGFGPAIFKKRSKKTGEKFSLRIIPLGGFCAFDGEDYDEDDVRAEAQKRAKKELQAEPFEDFASSEEGQSGAALSKEEGQNEATVSAAEGQNGGTVSETIPSESGEAEAAPPAVNEAEAAESATKNKTDEYPEPKGARFNDQAPWKRIIVLISGALMNYLLAIVLLLIMCFCYGVPMCMAIPVDYSGGVLTPVEWEVNEVSVADIIVSIDGKEIGMYTDCMDALNGRSAGEEVPVVIYRLTTATVDGEEVRVWKERDAVLTLLADANFANSADTETLESVIGFTIGTQSVRRDFWHTVGGAFEYSGRMATSVLRTLGELITGAFGSQTADVVGGPVSTIGATAQIAGASPFSFLYIASFIGVNLAVFNLLPVPALDGCKVIFCLIEWIRKKPINRKVEMIINVAGIIFLFGFAILIDLLKLF